MSLLGVSSDAWVGFVGAVVGGGATYATQRTADAYRAREQERERRKLVSATALLIQDDFLHYQSTLARALDSRRWWLESRMLPTQATVEDRKVVWAELGDEDTLTAANAQGWMDYLVSCRKALPKEDPPALTPSEVDAMRMTFEYLEEGRQALAELANRPATPFSKSRVFDQLTSSTVEELLGKPRAGG
jgi:hypothetical protein